MIINGFGILGVVLEPAAHTAPKRILGRTVHPVRTRLQRKEIGHHPRRRILLAEYVVVQGTFVIIGHLGRGIPTKQVAAQFQHVVCATGLACITADMRGELVRGEIMFLVAAATRRKRVTVNHRMPEKLAQGLTVRIAGQFIIPGLGQHFRDERVRVLRAQIVLLRLQWVYDLVVVEETGQPFVTFVARQGIKVVKRLVDASELVPYHLAARLFRKGFEFRIGPVAHLPRHLQSLRVACIKILVYQPGEYLVQSVPRCPNTCGTDITVNQFFRKCT